MTKPETNLTTSLLFFLSMTAYISFSRGDYIGLSMMCIMTLDVLMTLVLKSDTLPPLRLRHCLAFCVIGFAVMSGLYWLFDPDVDRLPSNVLSIVLFIIYRIVKFLERKGAGYEMSSMP